MRDAVGICICRWPNDGLRRIRSAHGMHAVKSASARTLAAVRDTPKLLSGEVRVGEALVEEAAG